MSTEYERQKLREAKKQTQQAEKQTQLLRDQKREHEHARAEAREHQANVLWEEQKRTQLEREKNERLLAEEAERTRIQREKAEREKKADAFFSSVSDRITMIEKMHMSGKTDESVLFGLFILENIENLDADLTSQAKALVAGRTKDLMQLLTTIRKEDPNKYAGAERRKKDLSESFVTVSEKAAEITSEFESTAQELAGFRDHWHGPIEESFDRGVTLCYQEGWVELSPTGFTEAQKSLLGQNSFDPEKLRKSGEAFLERLETLMADELRTLPDRVADTLDEPDKSKYLKQRVFNKNLLSDFRQAADKIEAFSVGAVRYIAAKLISSRIAANHIDRDSFVDMEDRKSFGTLENFLSTIETNVSEEERTNGDAYLADLAQRTDVIHLLQEKRKGVQSSRLLDLIPISVIRLFSKKTRDLQDYLTLNHQVSPMKKYSDILKSSDEIENRLISEMQEYRRQNFPEIAPFLSDEPASPPKERIAVKSSPDVSHGFLAGLKARPPYAIPVGLFSLGSLMYLLSPFSTGWAAGALMIQIVTGVWALIYKLLNWKRVVFWPIPVLGFLFLIIGAFLSPKDQEKMTPASSEKPPTVQTAKPK